MRLWLHVDKRRSSRNLNRGSGGDGHCGNIETTLGVEVLRDWSEANHRRLQWGISTKVLIIHHLSIRINSVGNWLSREQSTSSRRRT